MSKHTPGPWEVLNARKEDWIGRPLDYWTVTAEGHDKWLCASPEWDPEHDEESTANARLIAAAPELLEACLAMVAWNEAEKAARPFAEDGGKGWHERLAACNEAFEKARAAIARAKGD